MKESYHRVLEHQEGGMNFKRLAAFDITELKSREFYINRINVPSQHRRKGIASEMLKQCLADADKEGVTLVIEACPSDGLNRSQLQDWYGRYGFKLDEVGVWRRLPQRSCPSDATTEIQREGGEVDARGE